jgi:outer membrane protein assembly factor BamB
VKINTAIVISFLLLLSTAPVNAGPGQPVVKISYRLDFGEHALFSFGPLELAPPSLTPDGRFLLAGTSNAKLLVVDAGSGEIVHTLLLDGGASIPPVIIRDRIYVGTDNGVVHCFSRTTFKALWESPPRFRGIPRAGPILWQDGILVIQDDRSIIHAIDEVTGETLQKFDQHSFAQRGLSPFTIFGFPGLSVHEGSLFAGFETGHVSRFELSLKDGKLAPLNPTWEEGICTSEGLIDKDSKAGLCSNRRVFRDVDSTPTITPSALLTGCYCRGLVALNPSDGKILWEAPVLGPSSPLVVGKLVIAASADGSVNALSGESGKLVWTTQVGVSLISDPQLVGNQQDSASAAVVVATGDDLFILAADTGRILSRLSVPGGFAAPPHVAGNAMFAISNEGFLYRLDYFR